MTEDEQVSKAAVELVAQFQRARGCANGELRCVVCDTTSKHEVVQSIYKYKTQKAVVYLCIDGCGIEFFQRLTRKLSEMFGKRVMTVKNF